MGHFTDQMTRLRSDIDASHDTRKGFVQDLTDVVSTMLGDFTNAHAEMARGMKAERQAFTSNLKEATTHLRRTVGAQRQALKADLDGACRAFHGSTPAGRGAKRQRPPRAEARVTEETESPKPKGKRKRE